MNKNIFLPAVLVLCSAGCGNAQTPDNKTQQTAHEINVEISLSNAERPLPLLGSWNRGVRYRESPPTPRGYDPAYQLGWIKQGHHLLLGFDFPSVGDTPAEPGGSVTDQEIIEERRAYYEAPLKRAAQLKLPISLIGTQWEQILYRDKKYVDLPPGQNPNVVTPDGKIEKKLSPFGSVEPWREAGAEWVSTSLMKQLQEWYPDPPRVILLSNNEATKLRWQDVEQDARYLEKYGKGRDDEFKRKVVADGWIERYRALQQGMRDALSKSWQSKVLFVGYNAFSYSSFGRWPGWINYSLATLGRIEPDPLMWDGGMPSYYTYKGNGLTDFRVKSPQIESMNWPFMQKQALQLNPNFWFCFSIWSGFTFGDENDMSLIYQSLGQTYTPERYSGYAQFGLWLLRPRIVQDFVGYKRGQGWTDDLTEIEPYLLRLAGDIDRIYSNETLKYFWRKGELVPNRAHQHPYQAAIPDEYKNVDRWFLLDTNLDPPRPWKLDTEIPVFSLALVTGEKRNQRWLVYAESPLQDRQNVEITIPEYGKITVNIPVAGAFYTVDEKTRKIEPVL